MADLKCMFCTTFIKKISRASDDFTNKSKLIDKQGEHNSW